MLFPLSYVYQINCILSIITRKEALKQAVTKKDRLKENTGFAVFSQGDPF
jgi:hypothetical protein